jgi:uncharacterized protein (DUF2141 family)
MKIFFIIITLLFPLASHAEDSTAAGDGKIDIKITNIENGSGTIYLSFQDSAEDWLSTDEGVKSIRDITQEISSTDDIIISIDDIAEGSYAISLFHDLNGNVELDTNFIGFPKEPFGFSAPMGKFGPPKFEEAAIEITSEQRTIEIPLN